MGELLLIVSEVEICYEIQVWSHNASEIVVDEK